MFIMGLDSVGGDSFDANLSSYDFTKVELQDIIVDEITGSIGKKEFTLDKGNWGNNTAFLATFSNNLEAGNLSMGGIDVDILRFKKRKKGYMEWLLVEEQPYYREQISYVYYDRLARSNVEYEYAIVPVTAGVEGEPIRSSIVALHGGLWVVDSNFSVNIFCEVDYGTMNHNVNTNYFELLDGRYPIAVTGELDYVTGSSSGRLLTRASWEQHKMDYEAETNLRESVVAFLKNGKPKILKNDKGLYYLIMADSVSVSPYKYDSASVTVDFNWTEIGDAHDLETLISCDLLPSQLGG